MPATPYNRTLNGQRALDHTVEVTDDLSPEAINDVLDSYGAERWGDLIDFRVPDQHITEFRGLSDDSQNDYWMEHAERLDLEHSPDPKKSALEFTSLVFEVHHQALDQREADMDDITTHLGKDQYIQAATDRALLQHHTENFTMAMLQGDWNKAREQHEYASQAAIDAEHSRDYADPTEMYMLDPSICRAHYAATVHIEWMDAEHALNNLESNGAETRYLRTLAQVSQRGSVNYVMPGINDEPDQALAPNTIETKLAELRYAPQHFLKLMENQLEYQPVPGTEFPTLPAEDHTELTSHALNQYIAQLCESTDIAFQTTWAPAIEHLAEQADTLARSELNDFPGSETLNAAHRQIAYEAAQATNALLHPADHHNIASADDYDQQRHTAWAEGIAAKHQLGLSDDQIVSDIAATSFPNDFISARNSNMEEWTTNNASQLQTAETALNEHGFMDYLRSERGDWINNRNDHVYHAITHNPNEQMMRLLDSLAETESKLLNNLREGVQNLDYHAIENAQALLTELNAAYEPVESIQQRRAEEHAAELASYNLQARNMRAIGRASRQYSRNQNGAGFDTMIASPGVQRLISQIDAGRYNGHDGDIATLSESAQSWQERFSE